jgi:hypothetical protein
MDWDSVRLKKPLASAVAGCTMVRRFKKAQPARDCSNLEEIMSVSEECGQTTTPMDSTGEVTIRWPLTLISIRKPT